MTKAYLQRSLRNWTFILIASGLAISCGKFSAGPIAKRSEPTYDPQFDPQLLEGQWMLYELTLNYRGRPSQAIVRASPDGILRIGNFKLVEVLSFREGFIESHDTFKNSIKRNFNVFTSVGNEIRTPEENGRMHIRRIKHLDDQLLVLETNQRKYIRIPNERFDQLKLKIQRLRLDWLIPPAEPPKPGQMDLQLEGPFTGRFQVSGDLDDSILACSRDKNQDLTIRALAINPDLASQQIQITFKIPQMLLPLEQEWRDSIPIELLPGAEATSAPFVLTLRNDVHLSLYQLNLAEGQKCTLTLDKNIHWLAATFTCISSQVLPPPVCSTPPDCPPPSPPEGAPALPENPDTVEPLDDSEAPTPTPTPEPTPPPPPLIITGQWECLIQ